MKYGYVREGKYTLKAERQRAILMEQGIDEMLTDSGKGKETMDALRKIVRKSAKGDTLYVTDLGRLGKTMGAISENARKLAQKGVAVVSLDEGIDTSTILGQEILNWLEMFLEIEKSCAKERQAEGIASAKKEGKSWGRKSEYEYDKDMGDEVFSAYQIGAISSKDATERLGLPYQVFLREFKKWQIDNGLGNTDLRMKNGRPFRAKENKNGCDTE